MFHSIVDRMDSKACEQGLLDGRYWRIRHQVTTYRRRKQTIGTQITRCSECVHRMSVPLTRHRPLRARIRLVLLSAMVGSTRADRSLPGKPASRAGTILARSGMRVHHPVDLRGRFDRYHGPSQSQQHPSHIRFERRVPHDSCSRCTAKKGRIDHLLVNPPPHQPRAPATRPRACTPWSHAATPAGAVARHPRAGWRCRLSSPRMP